MCSRLLVASCNVYSEEDSFALVFLNDEAEDLVGNGFCGEKSRINLSFVVGNIIHQHFLLMTTVCLRPWFFFQAPKRNGAPSAMQSTIILHLYDIPGILLRRKKNEGCRGCLGNQPSVEAFADSTLLTIPCLPPPPPFQNVLPLKPLCAPRVPLVRLEKPATLAVSLERFNFFSRGQGTTVRRQMIRP